LLRDGEDIAQLTSEQVREAIDDSAVVLDTRQPEEYASKHIQNSINVGVEGRFAKTAEMMLGEHDRTIVVAPAGRGTEAAMRLGRVGLDRVVGYVENAPQLFAELADHTGSSTRVGVEEFDAKRSRAGITVLDI